MSRTSLLLLSVLIGFSTVAAEAQARSAEAPPTIATLGSFPSLSQSGASQSFQLTPADTRDNGISPWNDDICYKIRAYIFKRDDDHAPEFVRSTTCRPRKPREKNATWPHAKLVPAK